MRGWLGRFALAVLAGAMAVPERAGAEGSLRLDEVLVAINAAPNLRDEIDGQRRKAELKIADVTCVAARHGSQWKHLGGGRAAPYECPIGDRIVKIEADRTYFDVNGKRLGRLGQASEQTLFTRATHFREGNFRWTWRPR